MLDRDEQEQQQPQLLQLDGGCEDEEDLVRNQLGSGAGGYAKVIQRRVRAGGLQAVGPPRRISVYEGRKEMRQ